MTAGERKPDAVSGTREEVHSGPMVSPRRHRPAWVLPVVVIAVVAGLAVGGYVLVLSREASSSRVTVLVPAQTFYSLPGQQFNAISFVTSRAETLNGTITNTEGVTVYLMTPAQVVHLSTEGSVGTYSWSSGLLANLTVTSLSVPVPAGQWNVVFWNPLAPSEANPSQTTTTIGFYTALILTAA